MGRRLVPFVLAAVLAAAGCAADPAAPEPAPADPAAQAADPCSDAAVHRQAEERLALAEGLATRARQDDQDGAPAEEVLAAYCGACDAAREVPAGSCARPRAEELAQRLAARLHALAVETARRRMQGPAPNWGRIRASLLEVAERVPSPEAQDELRLLCEQCERNHAADALYVQAVRIVKARDVARYGRAVELLDRIDPEMVIYPDARAYVEWIGADLQVRRASTAYRTGRGVSARELLDQAWEVTALGPEARATIRARRRAWSAVMTAYGKARAHQKAGRADAARRGFEQVLELEQDPANVYRKRAQAELAKLGGSPPDDGGR